MAQLTYARLTAECREISAKYIWPNALGYEMADAIDVAALEASVKAFEALAMDCRALLADVRNGHYPNLINP